eukprot:s698_g12.t1
MIRRPAGDRRVLRRPAAAEPPEARGGRRRPAHRGEAEAEEAEAVPEETEDELFQRYLRGETVEAYRVKAGGYSKGDWVVGIEASYCQQGITLAARCPQLRVGPDLVHIKKLKKIRTEDVKSWESNLLEEIETANLRREEENWRKREEEKKQKAKEKSSSSTASRKKKKKRDRKKKKKKKEREEKGAEEAPAGSKEKKKRPARKSLDQLFQGTGLDPDAAVRRRLARRVRKALKRNASTSSSMSSSSSGESSGGLGDEGHELLQDRSKVHRIAVLAPGMLAAQSVGSMRPFLNHLQGVVWTEDDAGLPPLVSAYHRSFLVGKLTGGVLREATTIAWVSDLLLQGRAAEAVDCLLQRLKSIELTAGGTPWGTSQKLELVPPPEASMGSRSEIQIARREARLDQEVKGAGGNFSGDRNKGKGKEKGGKGKEKGKAKAKEGEGKKNS